ncbi:PAS domain-containing sensor histidine kinase [Deinococcus roseus]|uniref:histidine kinase n=1 Tax=Deinococcus roseus TaxID=392414 RepID=A0ABQ2CZN7_9DEIO|nr:ATP-binding protein [Deinococcus roseus]GGJ31971.1 hypothetical protein GCM10008938_17670 [Deinococcus roseus]
MIPEQRTLSQLPLTQVLHALPEPAWLASADGLECIYNHKLTETFPVVQQSRAEQQNLLHPEDRAMLQQLFAAGFQGQQEFRVSFRVRQDTDLAGTNLYQWHQVQVNPVLDQHQVLAWLGIVRPLDQTRDVLEALFEHAPVGMALLDPGYRLQMINPKLTERTRYTRDEYLKSHLGELFPDTFQQVRPLIDQVLSSGEQLEPMAFQSLYPPEGQPAPHWQITYFPVKTRDGRMLGVGSLTENISARKEAEQQLQESREFLRRITEAVPAVISLRDVETGKTLFSNNYAASVIGYALSELEAMTETELIQLFPAEERADTYQHYQTIPDLAEGEVREREFRIRHKNGQWRWIYGKTTIFTRDAQGKALSALSASLDITERKEFEVALKHSEQQLIRLMEAQKRFVSEASHEIKTPLAGIQGNLEVLLRYADIPEEEKREILQDCHREATRLGRLVQDLLGMARGNTDLQMIEDDVRLEGMVQDTFRELERTRGNRQIRLGEVEPCLVLGDPDRLKQLLVILISNAIKYTPAGGQVTLQLKRQGHQAEIRVSDTGIGIGKEDLKHVFERFYRADLSHQGIEDPGGSGLGLSIARWIVEEHKGHIHLESELGKGTTAVVTFPLIG